MNILKSLKNAYISFSALSGIKTAFGQDKLEDSRSIEFIGDILEVDTAVNVLDDEGNPSVLPDGDYKTESGIEFKITDGLVSEINDPSKEAENIPAENIAEKVATEISDEVTEAIKEAVEDAISKVTESLSKQNAQIAQLATIVEKIAESAGGIPAGEAVGFSKKPKEKFQQVKKNALSVFAEEVRKK